MLFRLAFLRRFVPAFAVLAALSVGGVALAQTTGSIRPSAPAASPSPGNPDGLTPGEGLDERAARDYLARAGYQEIKTLMQDAQGIWRGTARKDAQMVIIALDKRGKIVAH